MSSPLVRPRLTLGFCGIGFVEGSGGAMGACGRVKPKLGTSGAALHFALGGFLLGGWAFLTECAFCLASYCVCRSSRFRLLIPDDGGE